MLSSDSIFFLVCQQGEFFLTAAFVGFLDKMSPQRTDGIVLFCQEHITDATDPLGVLFRMPGTTRQIRESADYRRFLFHDLRNSCPSP